MLVTIAVILLLLWGAGLVANIAGGLIHIVLVVAVIIFLFHFFGGKRGV